MKTNVAIQFAIVMVVIITTYLGFTREARLHDSNTAMVKCRQVVQSQCVSERQRAENCKQVAVDVCRMFVDK